MTTGLLVSLAGCELIVKPDVGLVPTSDATCVPCLSDAETVVDIDGDIEIVPNDGGDALDDADASASDATAGDAQTGQ